ncbi:MAG: flippase-like domain-containing protein [Deltaproteobacteria bacterium]|nr:flippase-like domain-containing protein [Deltaproteobacteria bacterium]
MTARRALVLAGLLAVAVVAGAGFFADLDKLGAGLFAYPAHRIAIACGLVLGNYGLRALRFRYYLGRLDIAVGAGEAALVFVAGFLFTVTPGKMGEVVKGWLVKRRHGHSATAVASSVVAERLTDVVGLLLVAAAGVWQFGAYRGLFWGVCGLCLAFLAVVLHPQWVPALLERAAHPRLGRATAKIAQAHRALRTLCAPRPLLAGVALAAAAWFLEAVAFRVLLDGLGAGAGLGPAVVIYTMATLFGAVSMLPGGVGSTEAVMVALLLAPALGVGLDRAGATLATLLIRFCTLWFGVALGGVAWAWLARRPSTQDR